MAYLVHFRFRKRKGEKLRTTNYYGWFFFLRKKKEKGKCKKLGGTKGETKGKIDSFFFFLESLLSDCPTQVRI